MTQIDTGNESIPEYAKDSPNHGRYKKIIATTESGEEIEMTVYGR